MKNTSGLYVAAGALLGVIAARTSSAEPAWAFLIVPAIMAFIAALSIDNS